MPIMLSLRVKSTDIGVNRRDGCSRQMCPTLINVILNNVFLLILNSNGMTLEKKMMLEEFRPLLEHVIREGSIVFLFSHLLLLWTSPNILLLI
jgi:hypothetical protein